ncbi:hypothetical protein [Streptomyces shaanxiensis]|uniref:Cell wall-active antibiotics response LiaF-like C-terminal domain-containing protein n=1 Tax=Streptomyces shaanxiensis TaxID=653357 RepID=A0ABP7VJ68_9ACTN
MAERGRRASRIRTWLGLAAVAVGCYLVGDPAHRAGSALEFAAEWWPWALLGLAALNLLRAAIPPASLIGPLALAAVSTVALVAAGEISAHLVTALALPAALALSGALLIGTAAPSGRGSRWSRTLTTGRVVIPAEASATLTLRAVLGELRADLTRKSAAKRTTVNVTAIAGHVRVAVPRDQWVKVNTSGALLTRIAETGPAPSEPPDPSTGFVIHVLGVCGSVGIVRV